MQKENAQADVQVIVAAKLEGGLACSDLSTHRCASSSTLGLHASRDCGKQRQRQTKMMRIRHLHHPRPKQGLAAEPGLQTEACVWR